MITGGKRVHGQPPVQGEGPLVSVVTVVYNGAATLERTIRSVLAQPGRVEYIIMDGGSTDGTLDILRRYDSDIDLWCSAPDKGIYDAMNKGIARCTGDWVGLINADDWYADGALERAISAAAGRPDVNIVHGDILIHYPNGASKVKHARVNGFLLKHWEMMLNHPSFLVRRSYYAGHPFDPSFRVGGDHHWTLRAWLEDPRQFLHLPEVIAHFSVGGASATIPLRKALREGDAVSRSLGLGAGHRWLSRLVKVALHAPAQGKLWFNQFVSPLLRRS
jgi:glycosyltransferase involved in cell wall biosynthesis